MFPSISPYLFTNVAAMGGLTHMRTLIVPNSFLNSASNSSTTYPSLCGPGAASNWGSSTANKFRVPIGGTIGNIRANFNTTIATGSYELALMVDDVAVLTGTISSGNSLTVTGTYAVTANQSVMFRLVPTGTPTASSQVQVACTFDATESGESLIFSGFNSGTGAGYAPLGASNSSTGTEPESRTYAPTDGVLDDLIVNLSAAPGAGITRTYTLYKNGVATALTVSMTGAGTGEGITWAKISGQNISVAKGDYFTIRGEQSATPATAVAYVALTWIPTILGESWLPVTASSGYSTTDARMSPISGRSDGGRTTSDLVYCVSPVAFTLRKPYAAIPVAPGGTDTRTFAPAIGGVNQTNPDIVLTGAAVTGENSSETLAIAAGDLINWIATPANIPAAISYAAISSVGYIDPI